MKLDLNIDIHHLARVEGHGNIVIRIKNGEIEEARWDVVETPRYFEVMLKDKHFNLAPVLASRICGICSISHTLASLRATETAFGVSIPETAVKLRLLGARIGQHRLNRRAALPFHNRCPIVGIYLVSRVGNWKVHHHLKLVSVPIRR